MSFEQFPLRLDFIRTIPGYLIMAYSTRNIVGILSRLRIVLYFRSDREVYRTCLQRHVERSHLEAIHFVLQHKIWALRNPFSSLLISM